MAVRQMPAMRQIHSQDGIAGLQHRRIRRLICLRSGMRLHIGMLSAEKFLGPIASQIFDDVRELAPAVITLPRITFCVFIREDTAGSFQHGFGDEVLAGNQLQASVLTFHLMLNLLVNFRVDLGKRTGHALLFGHSF